MQPGVAIILQTSEVCAFVVKIVKKESSSKRGKRARLQDSNGELFRLCRLFKRNNYMVDNNNINNYLYG